jgi:hypothetical protein
LLVIGGNILRHISRDIRILILPVGGGLNERAFWLRHNLPFMGDLFGLGIGALIAIGACRWFMREGAPPFLVSALVYYFVISFWRWSQTRLLYPIQFQLLLSFLFGIEAVLLFITRVLKSSDQVRWPSVVLGGIVVGLAGLYFYKSATLRDSRLHAGDVAARTQWLKENAEAQAVLMTELPQVDYLYSGRPTVPFIARAAPSTQVERYMQSHAVDYVLVAPDQSEWQPVFVPAYGEVMAALLPELDSLVAQGSLQKVYVSEDGWLIVYRRIADGP